MDDPDVSHRMQLDYIRGVAAKTHGEGGKAPNKKGRLETGDTSGVSNPAVAQMIKDAAAHKQQSAMPVGGASPSALPPVMGNQPPKTPATIPQALANTLLTLGKDEAGNPVQEDLKDMPHMLIAGQTGSGKSYKMKEMLSELMHNNTPDQLKTLLIDPKGTEFSGMDTKYSVSPTMPIVKNPEQAITALTWLNGEMDRRLSQGVDSPKIVAGIDELGDLLANSPPSVERTLTRLAAKSRSAGIHMLLGTQRPDASVLKGLMKANIPARMAFKTPDKVNSNIILGRSGAEALEPYHSIYMSPKQGVPTQLFPSSYTGPQPEVPPQAEVAKAEMGRQA